jgi:hypothetical protein
MAACGGDDGGGGGNTGGNNTGSSTQLSATYYHDTGLVSITFSGSNWSSSLLDIEVARGTYKVNGNSVAMTTTWVNNNLGEGWSVDTWPGHVWYMKIINDTTLYDDDNGDYYRKM